MLQKFENHIIENFPFLEEKKLLLATSGGIDSMTLLHLFLKLNYNITIAHCNFQLRGIESFEDQNFVQDYANANKISIFVTQFDTENFAKDYKLSTQIAARKLRYNWFYELLETEKLDYILTAHHADDSLETFIINLSRGTGLDGLTGIPEQNDKIIRPLLLFSREKIENYAKENNLKWREDSSNVSDKYLRNKIRHHIIPALKELDSNFLSAFDKTQKYLKESQSMVEDATILIYQQVAKEVEDDIHFDVLKLKTLPNYKSYLYQWLKDFGFSDWSAIYDLVDSQSGKQILSPEFRLLKNRATLILTSNDYNEKSAHFFIEKNQKEVKFPVKLAISKVNDISDVSNKVIFVDEDKLQFPLILRKWEEGDDFQPFGMNNKSKKVSKFFKDEKLSILEKETIWILCSGNQIVWITGIRQDERFKIENETNNILKIALE